MLEINGLFVSYGKNEVLRGVDLTLGRGTLTSLIGPNGCGKSTLLRSIVGAIGCTGGTVSLDGVPLQSMPRNLRAQRIAYLAQGRDIPDITVGRLVLHGRFPYLSYPRRYRSVDFEIAQGAMERMGIAELSERPVAQLSGGMRQKAYIAMALCQQAEIIMLDEPAAYLDISEQFRLAGMLRMLADEGRAVLAVSHDIAAALKSSDRIAVMQDGAVMAAGSAEDILESGVISEVFGVEVFSSEQYGEREFFFRPCKR